jgi:drug/metabolite transporter (DMT)-like permease
MMLAWQGIVFALASAILFGTSTPLAKLLLGSGVSPWLLAGLLYFFSGLGLAVLLLGRRVTGIGTRETPLKKADLPWLIAVIITGGVVAPVLLMAGLAYTDASAAALLLNLEGVATIAIAWLIFHEAADTRIVIGAIAIIAGAILLSWQGSTGAISWGALGIAGASIAWAIDNNLTRRISNADPIQIAMIKGLVAGAVNLTLAVVSESVVPTVGQVAASGVIGFLGYGVSLVLFVLALRHLGAARTGAYFAVAPFVGVVIAVTLLSEPVTPRLISAGLLIGLGLWLHLTERHEHHHHHAFQDHEHGHTHDDHHQHEHTLGDPLGESHAHRHTHQPIVHGHPHYPDLHHEHPHKH